MHRVVHGGARFRDPVVIDARVRTAIFALEAVDPIHNAPALRAIERATRLVPGIPEIAVFDTGFHPTLPDAAYTYAVPTRWRTDWGVRRSVSTGCRSRGVPGGHPCRAWSSAIWAAAVR